MSRAEVAGPYDLSLVEGSITTPEHARTHPGGAGRVAPAGHDRCLRHRRRDPGTAQFRRRRRVRVDCLRPSRVHRDARRPRRPIADHVDVDLELHGCPIDRHQLLEVVTAYLAGRRPVTPWPQRLPGVQGPRNGLPARRSRHAVPRAGDAGGLRGALPVGRPRLLRLLRSGRHCEHRLARSPSCSPAGVEPVDVSRLFRTFNAKRARPSGERERSPMTQAHGRRATETRIAVGRQRRWPRPRRGRRRHCASRCATAWSATWRSRSSSRRGSSRRCCVGRRHSEAPDITSRICGICPVAYQMSACAAIEDACGVSVDERIVALRRLLYCGEWIQSHALHVYLLHAPDFLGCEDAVELAERDRAAVERGLELKRIGNLRHGDRRRPRGPPGQRSGRRLLPCSRSGGRSRPWPSRCGGPATTALGDRRVGGVASTFPTSRPTIASWPCAAEPLPHRVGPGRVLSDGLDITPAEFAELVGRGAGRALDRAARPTRGAASLPHRTARPLRAQRRLAARDRPRGGAGQPASGAVCRNPFRSIVVRAVELVFACDEALRLVESYEPPDPAGCTVPPAAGVGTGATEAPRGPAAPPLRARRRGDIRRGAHHAADLAEPAHDRGRTCGAWSRARSSSPTRS